MAPDAVWVRHATADDDERMARRGLTRVRTLVQLRRPLPLPAPLDADPAPVRPFRPGPDDDDWLRVNNRAFHWHPEQGGWDRTRLRSVLGEPWVDLKGFLVHDGPDGRLDGFCWTKVHGATDADPPLGEIYVIASDPAAHGSGLGRGLVVAGLRHLSGRGLGTAMLWVEADNIAARRLYDRLGFAVHHEDAAYAEADHP
jgi:mycothiol synthase